MIQPGEEIGFFVIAGGPQAAQMHRHIKGLVHFITPEEVGSISFLISFCLLHPFLFRPALIPPTEAKCPDLSYPAGHKKRSFVSLLYSSAIGGGDYSSEWLLCPSPIPMAPSLTNNFLLLRTLSIRYPNPPIFYRMATPQILIRCSSS